MKFIKVRQIVLKSYTTYKKFTHNFNHKVSFTIVNVAKEKHLLINIDETLRRKNRKKGKKMIYNS